VRLLAAALGVPPSSVSVVSGLHGRSKIVEVTGLGEIEIQRRLAGIRRLAS
jgi:uncharacterized protein YggU (UPF0235/DUF167 family)